MHCVVLQYDVVCCVLGWKLCNCVVVLCCVVCRSLDVPASREIERLQAVRFVRQVSLHSTFALYNLCHILYIQWSKPHYIRYCC